MKIKLLIITLLLFVTSCSSTYLIQSVTPNEWDHNRTEYIMTGDEKTTTGKVTLSRNKAFIDIDGWGRMEMTISIRFKDDFEEMNTKVNCYEGLIKHDYVKLVDFSRWGYFFLFSDISEQGDRFKGLMIIKLK
jgi:hypothetical protein